MSKIWDIYVDETYIEKGMKELKGFVTGFVAIKHDKEDRILEPFEQKLYSASDKEEIKSTEISDFMIAELLDITNHFGTIHLINRRKGLSSTEKIFKNTQLIIDYIMPIKSIMKRIKRRGNTGDIIFNVFLDERSEFLNEKRHLQQVAQYFLDDIAKNESSPKVKFSTNLNIVDSKEYIGIQAADILCGAINREAKYSILEPDRRIVPFDYIKVSSIKNSLTNNNFINIFGTFGLIKNLSEFAIKTYDSSEDKKIDRLNKAFNLDSPSKEKLATKEKESTDQVNNNPAEDKNDTEKENKVSENNSDNKVVLRILPQVSNTPAATSSEIPNLENESLNLTEEAQKYLTDLIKTLKSNISDKNSINTKHINYLNRQFKGINNYLKKIAKKNLKVSIRASKGREGISNYIAVLVQLYDNLPELNEAFVQQIKTSLSTIDLDKLTI